jgi:hypothetical protein
VLQERRPSEEDVSLPNPPQTARSSSNDVLRSAVEEMNFVHVQLNGQFLTGMVQVFAGNPCDQVPSASFKINNRFGAHRLRNLDRCSDRNMFRIAHLVTKMLGADAENNPLADIFCRQCFELAA